MKVGKKKERKHMGQQTKSCPASLRPCDHAPWNSKRHRVIILGGGRRRPWLRFLRGEVLFLPGRLFFFEPSLSESSLAPVLSPTKKQRNNIIHIGKQVSFRSKTKRQIKEEQEEDHGFHGGPDRADEPHPARLHRPRRPRRRRRPAHPLGVAPNHRRRRRPGAAFPPFPRTFHFEHSIHATVLVSSRFTNHPCMSRFTSVLPQVLTDSPVIIVLSGQQSSGKSSVLESIVGTDFLPRGSGQFQLF